MNITLDFTFVTLETMISNKSIIGGKNNFGETGQEIELKKIGEEKLLNNSLGEIVVESVNPYDRRNN